MALILGVLTLLGGTGAWCPSARSGCENIDPGSPRTLVLAVDGVPLRSVRLAQQQGAFSGWPEPQPLISTFPSVTNVAFSAILLPFGADPAGGYEVSHFDLKRNKVVGATPFGYEERLYPWRDVFDVTSRSFASKFKTYTAPKTSSRQAVAKAEELLFKTSKEIILGHVGATDAMMHLRGDKSVLKYLLELDRRIQEIEARHESTFGRPLRVVLLSDHGNTSIKIHKAKGLRRTLKQAGLKVVKHLDETGEVVAPTFGIVSYGALFTHQQDANTAGRAIVTNPTVDVAAWLSGPTEMFVASEFGVAVVHWLPDARGGWRLSYEPMEGDALGFADVVARLRDRGLIDEEGFAGEQAWFDETVDNEYPDALRRLIHSLTGTYVENFATVVFSLKPGYAWGWTSAHVSSKLSGGRLEGTHGGLDRGSSMGFYLSNDPLFQPVGAVQPERALEDLSGLSECLVVTGDDDHSGGHSGL